MEKSQKGTKNSPKKERKYLKPAILWEEKLSPTAYGQSCAKPPFGDDQCQAMPNMT